VRSIVGYRDIRLPGHQFQRLAAQQSRHDRHLSLKFPQQRQS
jgi:hypothetical protein